MRNRIEIPPTVTEELTTYLADWRRTHKPPTPLPQEVWSRAGRLAAQYGVHATARALGLGAATLRKHLAPSDLKATPRSASAFVEWLPPVATALGDCTLEVDSGHGARLRVEVKNIAATGLATLLREFCK